MFLEDVYQNYNHFVPSLKLSFYFIMPQLLYISLNPIPTLVRFLGVCF